MKNNNKNNELLKDCNCLNCRLGRIEEQLEDIQNLIETRADVPNNPGKSRKKK